MYAAGGKVSGGTGELVARADDRTVSAFGDERMMMAVVL